MYIVFIIAFAITAERFALFGNGKESDYVCLKNYRYYITCRALSAEIAGLYPVFHLD